MKPALYSPSRYIHLLTQHLDDAGIDCAHVLNSFGLDRELLAHPETQLQPLLALGLFRALADLDGRSDIGLLVGKRLSFGDLGETGRAMLSSANVREALDVWAEFHTLISPSLSLRIEEHERHLALCWVPIRPIPFDFLKVAYDMAIAGMDTLLQSVLGDRCPHYEVLFSYMAPAHVAQYGRLTHAVCHFDVPGLPCLRLRIDKEILATPMPWRNPGELAMLRKRLHQRLALTPMHNQWTAWVSLMIEQANGEQPTLEDLARLIQVSAATLTRRLGAEGSNFRTLSSDIRYRQARQWLSEGQWMISDISQRLGYANLPAFVRAFKARSGMSPSAFAKAALTARSPEH